MSVTITITDPTEEEARRVADYLMELGGYQKVQPTTAEVTAAPVLPPLVASAAPVSPEPTATFASIPVIPAAPHDVELDSAGMPWDGRIHSDTKSKIGDGTWRTRRGADPAVVAAVTAELKAAMGAPAAPSAPAALVASSAPSVPVPPPFVASVAPSVPPAPIIPAAGSAGAAPTASHSNMAAPLEPATPPVSIAITTFPQLMMAITKGIAKGTFTQSDVVKAIEGVGLASIPMLASRPDLIPAVAAELGV